ncbi:zinc-binding alcohol dehydrogenase family protein [Aspergillus aculeatinus CBS 121060]|uniref:Alcohol dehydrogenase n=1 Tax=Aspergillus aculeatinus CBS 121060 TaxID=1448322 RepID=A0ACD1H4I8_9EURO|nr:alcohol dehydrogenase [Aspergillus aculeatinus CBS 121060]RAH68488.1 alcohol dehydrogenase [Aspergillus aculeatinus CBS 121060]
MASHPAVIATNVKEPLTIQRVPTPELQQNEIRVRIEWVVSAPLDVYQVDAGLMAQFPQSLGDSGVGTVVAAGPGVKCLQAGDQVFGFFFHNEKEKGQQVYVTAPEHLFGKVPSGIAMPAAATVPTNVCTAYLTLTEKLNLELPWPRPSGFSPKDPESPIIIWGGGSSVGQYAIQLLHHWGYKNVITTASPQHHEKLRLYGAQHVIDYRESNVVDSILEVVKKSKLSAPIRAFDCVSSKSGSLQHVAKIASLPGSIIAAVLPVVLRSPSDPAGVQLSANVEGEVSWAPGLEVHSIVSYTFETNPFLKDHLLPDIIPALLASGSLDPNKYREIEGASLLQRASTALDVMRTGTVSGERLVWKVWTAEEYPEFV